MKVKLFAMTLITLIAGSGFAFAADGGSAFDNTTVWLIITAGFALALAASFGAVSQSRAIISACEGISRNPGSADAIRGLLILGLAFIESLVIYVLLIDFILLFVTIGRVAG